MLAGERLRTLRDQLGLTLRDVEAASVALAAKRGNGEFVLQLSRLSDIETKGIIPSIYRLYSLAVIYRRDVRELMEWYGINLEWAASDSRLAEPRKSHKVQGLLSSINMRVPAKLDPAFDLKRTTNIGRMVER